MRKIISFMHISLDGFVAGPNGEMNWIKVAEVPKGCSEGVLRTFGKIFDHVPSARGLAPQPVQYN